jgi:hypothetical protein
LEAKHVNADSVAGHIIEALATRHHSRCAGVGAENTPVTQQTLLLIFYVVTPYKAGEQNSATVPLSMTVLSTNHPPP